jgi:hypothetical protein
MHRRFVILLLAPALALAVACGSDSTDPLDGAPTAILILDDDSTQVQVDSILTAEGFDVTLGGYFGDWTSTDFSGYALVILLNGYDYGDPIPDTVQQAMLDFATAGGTLLTTEWLGYSEQDSLLLAALPLAYDGTFCDSSGCAETYTRGAIHPITEGVAASFLTPSEWNYSYTVVNATSTSSNITVLYVGSTSGPALAIGDYGSGHILHWNMAGEYVGPDIWDANTAGILTNIASYAQLP